MINCVFFIVASFLLISTSILAQSADGKLKVAIVKTAYSGLPSVWHEIDVGLELTEGPDILEREGLLTVLEREGCTVKTSAVELTPEEQQEFGVRHRLGIANGHLGRMVSAFIKQGYFPIGLHRDRDAGL
jgi:hypothetical protein